MQPNFIGSTQCKFLIDFLSLYLQACCVLHSSELLEGCTSHMKPGRCFVVVHRCSDLLPSHPAPFSLQSLCKKCCPPR